MVMITKTDVADNLTKLSEGRVSNDSLNHVPVPSPTFIRMIVLEVVSDPTSLLKDKNESKKRWNGLGVTNINYIDVLPRNTIIAKKVGEDVNPMFVFPFFPSHLSMPCKPGECVWAMIEKPEAAEMDMAFWMCRVVEPHMSDDVNHTHPGRSFEISMNPGAKDRFSNEKSGKAESGENVWHELRNAPVLKMGKDRITSRDNLILKGEKEDIFETLITKTDASKLMSYESIPRFRKRPGDVSLEGTNNTLIVLGTDRTGPIEKTSFEKDAGSIDIVAGRGQTNETFGKETATTRISDAKGESKGTEIKKELNKTPDVLSDSEGDPDFKNDRSRILVSQRTSPDKNFGLSSYNQKLSLEDSADGDASIVIKTDKIRLIARSDVEIVVSGFDSSTSPSKQSKKDEKTSTDDWASIVINAKGEVIIKPSKKGLIKLGGEDADKAILCSTSIPQGPGKVSGMPLTDTMGGNIGVAGASSTGVYSSKVLIK